MKKKKKQESWVSYTELTNEEAVRKYGKSLMFVGRIPTARPKKSLKDVYKGAASALTVQFDGEEHARNGRNKDNG